MSQILWVDDEIDLLQPYIIYLKGKGYEVATASNGEDALDAFSDVVPDIVFLDEFLDTCQGSAKLVFPVSFYRLNALCRDKQRVAYGHSAGLRTEIKTYYPLFAGIGISCAQCYVNPNYYSRYNP